MPIITVKEFADLCGDAAKSVEVWILRGKIMVEREGKKKFINTEDPINASFAADRKLANSVKNMGEIVQKEAETVPEKAFKPIKTPKKVTESSEKSPNKSIGKAKKEVKSPIKVQKKVETFIKQAPESKGNAEIFAISKAKMDLDRAAKEQEMELKAIRIQSEKIRLDKTAGNLLPIDLAAGVIERHANSILKTFEKGFARIGDIYSSMAGFGPEQRADFLKECQEELAVCVTKAGEKSQEEIEILVDNYSETLMTGQRKA